MISCWMVAHKVIHNGYVHINSGWKSSIDVKDITRNPNYTNGRSQNSEFWCQQYSCASKTFEIFKGKQLTILCFFSSKSFLIYNLCGLLRYLGSTFCQFSDVLMQSTFVCIHFVCVQLICLLHNSMYANVGDSLILNTIINYHKLCWSIFLQWME